MQIMTRAAAHAAGLKHFYTGRPCKKGHDRERVVSTGACMGCLAGYAKAYRAEFAGNKLTVVHVPIEHVAPIEAFAALFALARTNGKPAPRAPHFDDVATVNTLIDMLWSERGAAPPPPPVPVDGYEMWVRIHGKEIADQMRGGAV